MRTRNKSRATRGGTIYNISRKAYQKDRQVKAFELLSKWRPGNCGKVNTDRKNSDAPRQSDKNP